MSRLGIIAALPAEAKCLHNKNIDIASPIEIENGIFLCLSGIGHEAATICANNLLSLNIDALISWGVAGAINDSLKPGDLLIAESVIGREYKYVVSNEWLNRMKAYFMKMSSNPKIAPIASTEALCTSAKDKKYLSQKTGAVAVDMESAAIAAIAKAQNIDFLVIRSIADDANTSIPEAVIKHTDSLGRPKLFGFIISCLKKPVQLSDLIKLGYYYKKALITLKSNASDLKKQHFLYNSQSIK